MDRQAYFDRLFSVVDSIRESHEFHLNETDSEWLKNDIQAFMKKYGVEDWDKAVSMYSTHNVLPEDKVRAALGESVLQEEEESEEERHAAAQDTGEKDEVDVKDDSDPDKEAESPHDPTDAEIEDAYNYFLRSANLSSDPIRNNGKTGVSIDFDMECPHRKRGKPCGYCYVEDNRKNALKWIERIMKQGGLSLQQVKDNIDARKWMHVPGPGYKRDKKTKPIVQGKSPFTMGAQTPSMISGRVEYKPGTLQRKRKLFSPENIKKFNVSGGVRLYSFSDYNPEDDESLGALFKDADEIGLQIKAISKDPEFVKKWADRTGVTNLSVDNLEKDYGIHSNSLSLEDAVALKKKKKNVRIRTVAFNPEEAIRFAKVPEVDIVTPFHGRVNRLPKEMQDKAMDMKHGTPAHKELFKRIKSELSPEEKGKFCCYTGKCDTCKVGCGSDKREDPCSIDWDEILDDALGESTDYISYYRQGWVRAMRQDEDIICESYEHLLAAHMLNEQEEDFEEEPEAEVGAEEDFVEDEDEELAPEEEMPEEDFMEDEAEIPVPEDKEYVGKSEDTHFYMVPEKNDQGEIIDMKIVDQEENQLFSAEENGIEPTDMSLFLNTVFRDSDVGISEIDRQVIVKYIIPAAEQEIVNDMEDEEEELAGDDLPADDLGAEDEFAEEDVEAPEGEGDFEEELDDEGDEEMESPKKKKELMRPMESKLTEKRVEFDGHDFDVQLVDEGAEATVISVNGREFSFDSGFAELFHEDGALTESGVEELAKDALANLGQEEFEALAEASSGTKVSESAEFEDPTREEMLDALKPLMDEEGSEFDMEAAMYWYASDYHSGQNSNLYSVLSTSEYSPGASHSSVADDGEMAEMMYKELEAQFGGEGSEEGEEEHQDEPEEYDIFLSPAGSLGGQTQVKAGGKVIGTFNDEDEARQAAREWMEDNKFWPPVWVVSDHGNYHEISLGREDEMDTKESKVEEQGEFKHVYLVKYLKDDGEEAEMRVEALDDNDAERMMLKRKGVDKVTAVKKIAESEEVEESEGDNEGKNGYVAFYNGKKMDIYDTSLYGAKKQAIAAFKPPKSKQHMVAVELAEKPGGEQVTHVATESTEVDEALSRKYYIKFAEMMKGMEDRAAASTLAKMMAAMFKEDNPRFDSSRFMAAADVVMEAEESVEGAEVEEAEEPVEEEVADEKCKDEVEEEVEESEDAVEEGKDEPGKRDGTGSYQGKKGKRKEAGEDCPMEDEPVDEEKDPDAKVRNRGECVFQSTHENVRDDKDHFPINSEDQARNALARVAQYESAPAWYKGTLESLREAVKSAVKEAYPSIEVAEKKIEEFEEVTEEVTESIDPAFSLASELLGLNESVDTIDEIKEGTEVTIMSNKNMRVIYECVKVAKVTEHAVEVTGNEAEVDQEWYSFDLCQIYPV